MQHHGYQTMWIPWNDKLQVVIYKQFLSTGITWFQSLWFLVKITLWSNPHHCSQRFLLQMMLFLLLHLCAINKNAVCPIYIQTTLLHTNNFFLPREISEEILIGDNRCSSITKGGIYHIKYNPYNLFTMGVDWPEIGPSMEVSIMFDITDFAHIACLLCTDLTLRTVQYPNEDNT